MTHTHTYLAALTLAERELIAKACNRARYAPPDDAAAAYFDPPDAQRSAELCERRLRERNAAWRASRYYNSIAEADEPLVFDQGRERAAHTGLVSASFGFHPLWGTGHTLRTDGQLALFWNGEEVAIVEVANVKALRVLLASDKPPTQAERRAAVLASI